MLPGGMMPVNQLVAIIRSMPPRNAVGLLRGLPGDRMCAVIQAIGPDDIVRTLQAAEPDLCGQFIDMLSDEQLTALFRVSPPDVSVEFLWMLPPQRLRTVVDGLPDVTMEQLIARAPELRIAVLLEAMTPRRGHHVMAQKYEHEVASALARANLDVAVPAGAPSGIVLVQGLERRIVVAARYGDDGRLAVRDAETQAYRMRAHAALAVSDHQPAEEIVRYCQQSRQAGRRLDAVSWIDHQDDGSLMRHLVSLFR